MTAIILPTWCEADAIASTMLDIIRVFPTAVIYVMDDGSPDGTLAVASAAMQHHGIAGVAVDRTGRQRGLTAAVLDGFHCAIRDGHSVVAVMDADGQHESDILPVLIRAVTDGSCDIAVGARLQASDNGTSWHRRCLASCAKALAGPPRSADPMSGFFAIASHRVVLPQDPVAPRGYKVLAEILAVNPHIAVADVRATLKPRVQGASKITWRVLWSSTRQAVVLAWRSWRAKRLTHAKPTWEAQVGCMRR